MTEDKDEWVKGLDKEDRYNPSAPVGSKNKSNNKLANGLSTITEGVEP